MYTKEEVIDQFNKTINFSIPSLMLWKEPFLTILDVHSNPTELAKALIKLGVYLQHQPPCEKNSLEERKISSIIAAMAKHPTPCLLMDAILLLKTSTEQITDEHFPHLTFILKTHNAPLAFAKAVVYFCNSSILDKQNPHYEANLIKIALRAEHWFGEPSLEIYFQQVCPSVFDQDTFEEFYGLSQKQNCVEFNTFINACALCLLISHNEDLFAAIEIIEPFIYKRINQLKLIPQELFQLPMILYTAKKPCGVADALISISSTTLFNEKTYKGSENLGYLISHAKLWFDDPYLLSLFQHLPLYRWSPKLMETCIGVSKYTNPDVSLSRVLYSVVSEEHKTKRNQKAYETYCAKNMINLRKTLGRYSFYNDTCFPEIDRNSRRIETPLPNKNRIRSQSETYERQEQDTSLERAHSIG